MEGLQEFPSSYVPVLSLEKVDPIPKVVILSGERNRFGGPQFEKRMDCKQNESTLISRPL